MRRRATNPGASGGARAIPVFGFVPLLGMLATVVLGVVRARLRKTTPDDAGVHGADDSGRSIAVLGGIALVVIEKTRGVPPDKISY